MAEITKDQLFGALKSIDTRLGNVENGIDELRLGLNALRGHMISIRADTSNISDIVARHDGRLDRIERRLERRELSEPQRPLDPAS